MSAHRPQPVVAISAAGPGNESGFENGDAVCGSSAVRIAAAASGWPMLTRGRTDTPLGPTLRELMRHRAAIAVLDLWVPLDDGLMLIEALRDHWRRVRLIAVASEHTPESECRVRAAGVDHYLPASDPDTICHTVHELAAAINPAFKTATDHGLLHTRGSPPTRTATTRAGPRGRSP